jgi:tricorn protease
MHVLLRSRRAFVALVFCIAAAAAENSVAHAAPLLVRDPAISANHLAFVYGGDIWIADRNGGDSKRLVTGFNRESGPVFSPDGTQVAFTGVYDGNEDVYVVPVEGGQPKRLTYDPGADIAAGWTPDGKDVLFTSSRLSTNDPNRMFTVPATGGNPTPLPLPMAESGSYSPDGSHFAYVPGFRWEPFWQKYRGGQTTPVYVADLADSSVVKVPRDNSNDDDPMWVGNTVYFLSDRDGPVTLFAYNTATKSVTRELPASGFDITSASAGPGAIVYAQFDSLHVFDLATHQSRELHVTPTGDFPQVRPHFEKVGDRIENADISPSGVRAVFEAHGDIFTVPVEHGDARNITSTPAVEERDPAWSPDGRSIAYFSDASGDYRLYVRDQRGLLPPRAIDLGQKAFFYSPKWSPDSKKIAYSDKHLNLWYVDLAHPTPVKVASAPFETFGTNDFEEAWSPDSRSLAYAMQLHNYLHAIDVYSLAENRSHRLTDGMSDAQYPLFDPSGKYLYFTASTNVGLTSNGLDMVSDQHPVTSAIYAAVLRKSDPAPDALQTGDEAAPARSAESGDEPDGTAPAAPAPAPSASAAPKPAKPAAASKDVAIDYDGILQRIVAMPIPAANYAGLFMGKSGALFAAALPLTSVGPGPSALSVLKYDPKSRKVTPFITAASSFALSADGSKALYQSHGTWSIVGTEKPATPGDGALATASLETYVQPREMWKQMYRETWHIERDFFYDPHYHGLDIDAAEKRFEPYLDSISRFSSRRC